ncbi:MAG: T9SS type A sorting domain-containing protein [Melioribacteraceae bacterium]|nr:MAG: T9SS type A sorting domain-containing protein [Melioribacteraceae bacterium]
MKQFNLLLLPLVLICSTMFSQESITSVCKVKPGNAFTSVEAPSVYLSRNILAKSPSSNFDITFEGSWSLEQQEAFQKAIDIWSYLIVAANDIKVKVEWDVLDATINAQAETFYYNNFPDAPSNNYQYPTALAKQKGVLTNPPEFDFILTFNASQDWSFSVHGIPYEGKSDFVTIAMHEIAHGLGVTHSIYYSEGDAWMGLDSIDNDKSGIYPTIFDKHEKSGSNLLTNITNPQTLGSAVTSGNVKFNGPKAMKSNNNTEPKLYSPSTWSGGSSIAHLDENTYLEGTINSLITPQTAHAEAVHTPGPILLGILEDLGWETNRFIYTLKPLGGEKLMKGGTTTINWFDYHGTSLGQNINIVLKRYEGEVLIPLDPPILSNYTSASGGANSFQWTISDQLIEGQYILQYEGYTLPIGWGTSQTFTISSQPAEPYFDPPPSHYTGEQNIRIFTFTEGATIKYSLDESEPTIDYTDGQSITINKTTIIKAKSIFTLPNGTVTESETVTGKYYINENIQSITIVGNAKTLKKAGTLVTELNNEDIHLGYLGLMNSYVPIIGRAYIWFSGIGNNIPENSVIESVELQIDFQSGIDNFYKLYNYTAPQPGSLPSVYWGATAIGGVIETIPAQFEKYNITNSGFISKFQDIVDRQSSEKIYFSLINKHEASGTSGQRLYSKYSPKIKIYYKGNVEVNQLASDLTPFGDVKIWENNSWQTESVPFYRSKNQGSQVILKASQEINPNANELMHRWEDATNALLSLINFNTFGINSTENVFEAKFSPIANDLTIKNSIEGYENVNDPNNKLYFKDPWLLDRVSSNHADAKYNSGVDAEFKELGSPFLLHENTNYKGVFKNQLVPDGYYYSIKFADVLSITLNGLNTTVKYLDVSSTGTQGLAPQLDNGFHKSPVVFTSDDPVVTANYKGSLLSNTTSALRGASQRKIARTPNGHLHLVYESMDHVWYERSTDGGSSWELMNNAQPLDNYRGKLPSIDVSGEGVSIVFQQDDNWDWHSIVYKFFLYGSLELTYQVTQDFGDYNSHDANPVLATGSDGRVFIVWERMGSIAYGQEDNLCYRFGVMNLTDQQINWKTVVINIPNSTSLSTTPSLVSDKIAGYSNYYLVWAESNNSIKYIKASSPNDIPQFSNVTTISNQSGYENHWNPEVVISGSTVYVGWVGQRYEAGEEEPGPIQWKTNAFGGGGCSFGEWKERGLLRSFNGSSWSGIIKALGSDVDDVALNTAGSSVVFAYYTETSLETYYTRGVQSGDGFNTIFNISDGGKSFMLSNGSSLNNMKWFDVDYPSEHLQPLGPPYSLKNGNIATQYKQGSTENYALIGREGVTTRDSVQFYFTFGEIIVDGVQVNFVELPDTMKEIKNSNQLNKFLVSEPFTLDDNSQFTYGVMCGVADSADVEVALEKNKYINFKVELIEDKSQKVLGVYDNVTFTSDSINYYSNKNYQVDTKGIGNKTVRLRLQVKDNFKQNYSIGNLLVEDSLMYKKGYHELNYKGELLVKDYDLVQNYPNPFNPTTTIKYQIPKSGHVKLRVYDILGREVTTLVNEYLVDGRYEAVFNANELSSGVYIYRLEVNDFVTSKKMMLVK